MSVDSVADAVRSGGSLDLARTPRHAPPPECNDAGRAHVGIEWKHLGWQDPTMQMQELQGMAGRCHDAHNLVGTG